MAQKDISKKNADSTPFSISQEIVQHSVLKMVNLVKYHREVKNEQMFGFTNSYIVFDYGGCSIIEPGQNPITSPKIYLKTARPYHFKHSKNENSSYIVFNLNPTSFFTITGLPANENLHNYISLDKYVNSIILLGLYEQCRTLQSAKEIATITLQTLQPYLIKWQEKTPIDTIIDEIISRGGMLYIEEILEKYPLSMSTLNRYFKKYVGMTVALYIRLVKFNTLILGLYTNTSNLQDIVAQYNFYDQTHLTKDFKKFSGITPKKYKGPNFELLRKALF